MGPSRDVKILPFGRFFWVNFGRNFTHKRKIQVYWIYPPFPGRSSWEVKVRTRWHPGGDDEPPKFEMLLVVSVI